MATTTVGTCLLQALDIIQDLSAEIVLNLHIRQHSSQVKNLLVGQLADAAGWVDVEAGKKARRGVISDSEESLKGFLFGRVLVYSSLVDWSNSWFIDGALRWRFACLQ